ncbi:DNA-directed RNA polymerase subunit beta [Halobacillus sp. Marseille-Q1614]|uniref:DNA-directed RNA polymerase subunit beta n=1 Tax=Halobacillus sp. Marseille-Q1614 TaxID=2709134 RepID=UPI00156FC785|nr:DNA-directed RNA polymerase subunit beta [Halobacillus sp. Marseille-Q1614]
MAIEEKQLRKPKKEKKPKARQPRAERRRMIPIWLRIVIVLVLSVVALATGLMIGYGVLGDGNPTDALKWSTWQQIIDIMSGK